MSRSPEIRACIVCVNIDCKARGSLEVLKEIEDGLSETGSNVKTREYLCLGNCANGPNIFLYPEGTFYAGVQKSDVPEIIRHINGGTPVTRLTEQVIPGLPAMTKEILDTGIIGPL